MDFEWDEDKRLANLAKHGLDFRRAFTIWEREVLDPYSQRVGEEHRLLALGTMREDETVIAVVYTERGAARRLISARRARRNERADYQNQFERGH